MDLIAAEREYLEAVYATHDWISKLNFETEAQARANIGQWNLFLEKESNAKRKMFEEKDAARNL